MTILLIAARILVVAISIGTSAGKPVRITEKTWLEKHVAIFGPTGSGKSRLMEGLAWQLILQGKGVAIIDVDDKTSDDSVARCAEFFDSLPPAAKHTIHHVKFNKDVACSIDLSNIPGVGKEYDINRHERIRQINRILARVNNLENLKEQQQRQRCSTNVLYLALSRRDDGSTFGAQRIPEILDTWGTRPFERIFNSVNSSLPVNIARDCWRMHTMNKRDLATMLQSTWNIWINFLSSPIVSQAVANIHPSIDFDYITRVGAPVFVSVDQKDREASDALACLFMTCLMDSAWYSPTPYYLFIEEAHTLLGPDMEKMFWARARKHGVGTVMSFPSLDSLKTDKWDLRKAALSIPRTKIFFQQSVDLEEISRFAAVPSFDFTERETPVQLHDGYKKVRTKSTTDQTQEGFSNQVTAQEGGSEGGSVSQGDSGGENWQNQKTEGEQKGRTHVVGNGQTDSEGKSVHIDGDGKTTATESDNTAKTQNQSNGLQHSKSVNFSSATGGNWGWSTSTVANWVRNFTQGFSRSTSGSRTKGITINESFLAQFKTLWLKDGLKTSIEVQVAKWEKVLRTLGTGEFVFCYENMPSLVVAAHHISDPFEGRPLWGKYQTERLQQAIWESKPCFFVPGEVEKWVRSPTRTKNSSDNSTTRKRWE